MVGRIREILFDEGVDVDGVATLAASEDYVDGKFSTQGGLIIDPHGWTEYDNTYMTRGWVGTTFTLTQVGASTPYYCKGVLKYLTGNKSITITPTAGDHFIALNCATEVLEDLGTALPIAAALSTHILVEFCYANGTAVTFNANERHTTKFLKRDWIYKHLSFSTQYRSGIQTSITVIDSTGALDSHAQFSVTAGTLSDEDIDFTVAAILTAAIKNVWYYNGTIWVKSTGLAGSGVLNTGSGRAAYNNIASGLAECTNNYHVLTHVFAANNGEILCIVGNAQYQLLANARIAASEEIATILDTGLPFPEFRAIATYISKTSDTYANATKSKTVSVDTGVPFIDWRETALNPVAGSAASNHQNLSGLQGGQAGEYYHLTAAQNTNISNNVFPAGTSTNTANKLLLPTNTTAGWNALTPTETLVGWDSTKKKPVVGNGTAIVPIGGGLTVTNITVSGTTPSIATLESGKHYIYNGAGASGDVTITMPAVAAESNIRVTVYNIPTTRKMSLARAGSDNFRKDDTLYTTVEFRAVEVEQSSEFVAATDAAEWLVNDGSNALGTVWSGALQVTGLLTASSGINLGNETLSVYDEGTWVPVIARAVPGTLSVTYGARSAKYTRIGNLVMFEIFLYHAITVGTSSGAWSVPLPFTIAGSGGIDNGVATLACYGADFTAGTVPFGLLTGGLAAVIFYQQARVDVWAPMGHPGTYSIISGHFFV